MLWNNIRLSWFGVALLLSALVVNRVFAQQTVNSATFGRYAVDVAAPGFAVTKHEVTVNVGQTLDVSLKLNLEGLTETVNVPTELPVLETVRTQLAEPVLPREIDSLPLNGRNYLDLAALTPGVSRSNPVANQRFPETYNIRSANARNVGGLNAASRGTALNDLDQQLAIGHVTTVSSRTFNEARFQYARSRLDASPNDVTGPAVNISGVANFGTATFSPTGRNLDTFEFNETITTQRAARSLKPGAPVFPNTLTTFPTNLLIGITTIDPRIKNSYGEQAIVQVERELSTA